MNYYVEPTPSVGTTFGFVGVLAGIFTLVPLIISVLYLISLWKIFVKCGKPGWAAIVPIYNVIVLLEIAGKELITLLLLCVPIYGIYVAYTVFEAIAKKFGKSSGFAILMLLFPYIAFPILAFSKNSEIVEPEYVNVTNTIENSSMPAVAPVAPAVEPIAPVAPVAPAVEPIAPVAPVAPAFEPIAPVAPGAPAVEPIAPAAPVAPGIEGQNPNGQI